MKEANPFCQKTGSIADVHEPMYKDLQLCDAGRQGG